MILLYSLFACSVILAGLVTAISIIRTGYADTSEGNAGENSASYVPEEHIEG
jgi:hypothetical protein